MRKRSWKYLTISLAAMLCLGGCSDSKESMDSDGEEIRQDAEQGENEEESGAEVSILEANPEPYTLPLTTEPITLSFSVCESWTPEYSLADNREIFQKIEEDTGVKIQWEVISDKDYDTVMKTRIASGDIPDIMGIKDSTANPVSLYEDGLTIDHGEYIAQYAPNIIRQMNENEAARYAMMGSDGKVYSATADIQYRTANVKGLYYRKDWQKKLGIADPVTLDDYYEMFLAFATQDPNGNGEIDEIALYPKQMQDFGPFATAFGLDFQVNAGKNSGFSNISGKVEYQYAKPEFKNLLEYIKKYYDAGIIPKEVYGSNDAEKTILANNRLGAFYNGLGQCDTYDNVLLEAGFIDQIDSDTGYYWLCPPENENGERISSPMVYCQSNRFVVSAACEYPEIAIKWLDYVWGSEEGARYTTYGIEGKSYNIVDGKPEFTDYILNNPDGLGVHPALRTLGAFTPWIARWTDEAFSAQWAQNEKITQIINEARDTFQYEPLPIVLGTPEEATRIASLQVEIDTYVEEMILKFVTGEESLDNFDSYLETLDDMGLQELLDIKNSQLEAYQWME